MRRMLVGFLIVLSVGTVAGCGSDDPEEAGKNGCVQDTDCTDGRKCNYDKTASTGQCMEATTQGWFMCTADNPCPSGQFCFNGLCAMGCMSNEDCASDQYCDTQGSQLCVNKEVTECSGDSDCAGTQKCLDGLCSATAVATECAWSADGNDGCDKYSVCRDLGEDDPELNSCVSYPPCPEDGNCPVGQVGSVCNDGDLPNKAAICLTGLCKSQSNCPSSWQCIQPNGDGTIGACSNGSFGTLCMGKDDCQDGLSCMGASGGQPGFCMQGGGGQDTCTAAGGTCAGMMEGCGDLELDVSKTCEDMSQVCCM